MLEALPEQHKSGPLRQRRRWHREVGTVSMSEPRNDRVERSRQTGDSHACIVGVGSDRTFRLKRFRPNVLPVLNAVRFIGLLQRLLVDTRPKPEHGHRRPVADTLASSSYPVDGSAWWDHCSHLQIDRQVTRRYYLQSTDADM